MKNARQWIPRLLRLLVPSARSLRMAAYSAFAFGLIALAAARSVRADVTEMGLDVGHQLAKLEDLTGDGYRIHVNGAVLHRASAHSEQSFHEVLARYETYCKENPGALGRAMQDIPSALADRIELPKSTATRASVLRDESNGRGMVVCFVDDPSQPELPLVERLQAVSTTGDLSRLGHFRYAFAEPARGGGTHVVTFWGDGELNLKKMFPADGDAPGSDSVLVPRPAGSRRTLSASVDGYPAAVRIYESLADGASITRMFDETLLGQGFLKTESTGAHPGAGYVGKDGAEIFVSFTTNGPRTSVTIVESKAPAATGVRAEVLP